MTTIDLRERNEWPGKLTRADAIKLLDRITNNDDPYWEHKVEDWYDEATDTMPTIYHLIAALGVSEAEYRSLHPGANINWPATLISGPEPELVAEIDALVDASRMSNSAKIVLAARVFQAWPALKQSLTTQGGEALEKIKAMTQHPAPGQEGANGILFEIHHLASAALAHCSSVGWRVEPSFVFIIRGDGASAEIVHGGHAALRAHFIRSIWAGSPDDLPEEILREANILGNPDDPEWEDQGEPRSVTFSYEDGAVQVIELEAENV